ncbi:collagen-like protein, partial [Streptomyces sp. NPDC059853]
MASSKTRANVARVAAAAIFAAGASLAVVGTANASGAKTEKDDSLISLDILGGVTAGADEGATDGGGDDEGSDQGASDEGADQGGDQGGSDEGADEGGD